LASAYQEVENLTNAAQHYRQALQLARNYPEAHYNLGTLLLRAGRFAEAEEQFAAAVKLMPGYAEAYNCLGIIRGRQNRRQEVLECFEKAVQCDANNWQAHFNLATAYLSGGNPAKAVPELRETLRLRPGYPPAQRALAKALGQAAPAGR
jgi:Tfp pilus assembly protein PilF